MKIFIASDHAGFAYKNLLMQDLKLHGFEIEDLGAYDPQPSDYPDFAEAMAHSILQNETARGIIICGSGVGVSVACNKFKGIRAAVCHDSYSAHQSVEHDNMNVLCLGERIIGIELAKEIVLKFLNARYSHEPRHEKRLQKMYAIENKNMKEIIS